MSVEEIYAAQGRAHANLRKVRSEIATIRAEIQTRSRALAEMLSRMDRCLRDPLCQEPGAPVAVHVQLEHDLRFRPELKLDHLAGLLIDLANQSGEAKSLEEEIAQF